GIRRAAWSRRTSAASASAWWRWCAPRATPGPSRSPTSFSSSSRGRASRCRASVAKGRASASTRSPSGCSPPRRAGKRQRPEARRWCRGWSPFPYVVLRRPKSTSLADWQIKGAARHGRSCGGEEKERRAWSGSGYPGLARGWSCPGRNLDGAAVLGRQHLDESVDAVVAHFLGVARAVGRTQADAAHAHVVALPVAGGAFHVVFDLDRLGARLAHERAHRHLGVARPHAHGPHFDRLVAVARQRAGVGAHQQRAEFARQLLLLLGRGVAPVRAHRDLRRAPEAEVRQAAAL